MPAQGSPTWIGSTLAATSPADLNLSRRRKILLIISEKSTCRPPYCHNHDFCAACRQSSAATSCALCTAASILITSAGSKSRIVFRSSADSASNASARMLLRLVSVLVSCDGVRGDCALALVCEGTDRVRDQGDLSRAPHKRSRFRGRCGVKLISQQKFNSGPLANCIQIVLVVSKREITRGWQYTYC